MKWVCLCGATFLFLVGCGQEPGSPPEAQPPSAPSATATEPSPDGTSAVVDATDQPASSDASPNVTPAKEVTRTLVLHVPME